MMISLSHKALLAIVLLVSLLTFPPQSFSQTMSGETGIPPRLATDYIHSVLKANRAFYSRQIVDRLNKKASLKVSENWAQENTLPLPAQFMILSSEASKQRNIGMSYRLMSLWPINPRNAPGTEFEKTGLKQVANHPEKPFSWVIQKDWAWYYQTIYPDLAITDSCVSCHNSHPNSPRKNFALGDVMGGIAINLPLGRLNSRTDVEKILIPPEIVADYIYSAIESDRLIYSKHIVDRLENKNIIHSTEDWKEEDALPLPAQFLTEASMGMEDNHLGLDYRLVSLWPINPKNGPVSQFERKGIERVTLHPLRPFIGQVRVGRRIFFQAVYPDLAVTEGCVICHNAHPNSPRKNFQMNDVLGGIVVTFPLKNKN